MTFEPVYTNFGFNLIMKKNKNNNEETGLLPLDFPEDNTSKAAPDEKEKKEPEALASAKNETDAKTEPNPPQKSQNSDEKTATNASASLKKGKIISPEKAKSGKSAKPPVKLENRKDRPATTKKSKPLNSNIQGSFLPGQILQEGRVRADLGIEQVAQATKIKKKYIESLEMGCSDELPPPVYIEAYIKQLCKLYKLDHAPVIDAFRKSSVDDDGNRIPGELLTNLEKEKQVNMQEEERVRKIVKVVAVAAIVIAVAVVLIVKFSGEKSGSSDSATPPKEIASAQVEQVPEVEGPHLPGSESDGSVASSDSNITSGDLEVFLADKPITMTELKLKR